MLPSGTNGWMNHTPPACPCTPPLQGLDGSFKAMAVTLPSGTELLDEIPEADPTLLYEVGLADQSNMNQFTIIDKNNLYEYNVEQYVYIRPFR